MDSRFRSVPLAFLLVCWAVPCPDAGAGDTLYSLVHVMEAKTEAPGSDCWGWTAPDGTEYAFMSGASGMTVYRTDPPDTIHQTDPPPAEGEVVLQITTHIAGPTIGLPGWRDYHTYKHYAYAVSEAAGAYAGLQVMDLSFLPDSVHVVGSFPIDANSSHSSSHNFSIDTVKGFAYVEYGFGSSPDIMIHDLSDPEHPVYVRGFGTLECHDVFADNDTVYVAEGANGSWSVWNLADKLNPALIARVSIPGAGFVHNIWPSPDRLYCVTTEETAKKTIKIWSISDLANVQLVAQMLGLSKLAHNAYWLGNLIFASHFESGVSLWDVSGLPGLVSLGSYDTYPPSDEPQFNGCWSVYPFTRNGMLYASNKDGRMAVLRLQATCVAPSSPVLLAPDPGDSSVPEPVVLAWQDDTRTAYEFLLDDDVSFASPEWDSLLPDTAMVIADLPYESHWYWKVRAENSCGWGDWSETRDFHVGCLISLTGDVDQSGARTAGDIIYLVNHIFKSGPAPLPFAAAGDCDCSGGVSTSDLVLLVNTVFKNGAQPCDVCTIL